MHNWGDDLKWDQLYEAIDFFQETYTGMTGKNPICKEKYGTLRLEMEAVWVEEQSDLTNLHLALMATACKYPEVAKEILDDYLLGELPQEVYDKL